jgi:hypothetical protein
LIRPKHRFPQTKELPASLREASDVLGRIKTNPKIRSDKIVSLPQNQFSETGQELARAARKGGAIPARVEEKMRHNRDQADAENRRKSKIH